MDHRQTTEAVSRNHGVRTQCCDLTVDGGNPVIADCALPVIDTQPIPDIEL